MIRPSRRHMLGLLGSAIAFPYVIRSDRALAAAKLVKVGNPIQLGAFQSGGKGKVRLSVFPSGDYVASWLHYGTGINAESYIQYFRAAGTALTSPILMGGSTGPTDGKPANSIVPVAYPDGTAGVLFGAPRNVASLSDANDIFFNQMLASRQKAGDATGVNAALANSQTSVFGVRLPNNRLVSAWQTGGTTTDSYDVLARILSPAGVPLTAEKRLNSDIPGVQVPASLVALTDSHFGFGYSTAVNANPGGARWKLEARFFDTNAVGAGEIFVLKNVPATSQFGSVGLAPIPLDPGLLAVWFEEDTANTADIVMQVLNRNGTRRSKRHIRTVRVPPWLDIPPAVPGVATYRQGNLGNFAVVTFPTSTPAAPNQGIIQATAVNIDTAAVAVAATTLRTSPDGYRAIVDSTVIQNPVGSYFLCGFTESTETLSTYRAYIQRFELQAM